MLANAHYALQEKLQLGHRLKPFAAVASPPVLVLWKITSSTRPPVRVCGVCVGACTFDSEEKSGLGLQRFFDWDKRGSFHLSEGCRERKGRHLSGFPAALMTGGVIETCPSCVNLNEFREKETARTEQQHTFQHSFGQKYEDQHRVT